MCKVSRPREVPRKRKEERCLCGLPMDLLQIIVGFMSFLDYFSVCAVCKCWRSVFLKCQPPPGQGMLPWFVVLKVVNQPGSGWRRPLLYMTGEIGDLSTECIYKPNIPEICGTRFLLSRHGWLLLFSAGSSSLFFFSPLSRTRIDLPWIDVAKLRNPMFDLSAPPTSPECKVIAISYAGDFSYMTFTCCRGESEWKSLLHNIGYAVSIDNTFYVKGILYCLHSNGNLSVFNTTTCELKRVNRYSDRCCGDLFVSYTMKNMDQVYLRVHGAHNVEISLTEPEVVVSLWRDLGLNKMEFQLRDSIKEAVTLQDKLQIDSFNVPSWCVVCKPEKQMMDFHWHNSISSPYGWCAREGIKRCPKTTCKVIAWFQPAWVDPSPSLKWIYGC